jgi:hypothetical protein
MRVRILPGVLSLVLMLLASTPAAYAQTTRPTSMPAELVELGRIAMEKYYANAYGDGLKERNRLLRLISVVSLSRIDAEPIVDRLLEAAADRDLIVAQVAWEAIHAQHASLSPAQREKWLDVGLSIRSRDGFPGQTGMGLLSAIAGYAKPVDARVLADLIGEVATDQNIDLLKPVVRQLLDSQPNADWLATLAMRHMTKAPVTMRLDAILRPLPDAPAATDQPGKLALAWREYARTRPPHEPKVGQYMGKSAIFPKPAKIDDPESDRWRKELELPKLTAERIELVYCIDSTGSMTSVNRLLAGTLLPLTRTLGVCVDDIRAGVVYYRHETDPALQKKCCEFADKSDRGHLVRSFPLSREIYGLVRSMRAVTVDRKAGHDEGTGAYAAALEAASLLAWSNNDQKTRKIVIVIGDAVPTAGSIDACVKLAQKLKQSGVAVHFLCKDKTTAQSVAPIASAAGTKPVVFGEDMSLYTDYIKPNKPPPLSLTIKSQIGQTVLSVVRDSLPPAYADRVQTVFEATLPILQGQLDRANQP